MKNFVSLITALCLLFSAFSAFASDVTEELSLNIDQNLITQITISNSSQIITNAFKYSTTDKYEIDNLIYLINCYTYVDDGKNVAVCDADHFYITLNYSDESVKKICETFGRINIDGKQYGITNYVTKDIISLARGYQTKKQTAHAIDTKISLWAKDDINAAINAGIVPKTSQVNYQYAINRNEAAILIYNYLKKNGFNFNENSNKSKTPFTDNDSSKVKVLYYAGLINGKSDVLFGTYDNLTREEFAKIIISVYDELNDETVINNDYTAYNDENDISDWAKPYIIKAQGLNIMKGDEVGNFHPHDEITKEETISALMRLNINDISQKSVYSFKRNEYSGLFQFTKNNKTKDDVTTEYWDAKQFSEGLCAVTLSPPEAEKQYWGYADTDGNIVIPCFYTEAGEFHNGKATVKSDTFDEPYKIDKNGNRIDGEIPEISTDEKIGSKRYNLNVFERKIEHDPNIIRLCSELDGIEYNGKTIAEPSFGICSFSNGYGVVDTNFLYTDNNICGVINSDGKLILPFKYRPAFDFVVSDGLLGAYDFYDYEKDFAYYNMYGKNEFGDKYFRSGRKFSNGYAAVKTKGEHEELPFAYRCDGDEWRYINRKGEFATDKIFDYAEPFDNGFAEVISNGKAYKINTNFDIVKELSPFEIRSYIIKYYTEQK